MLLAERGPPGNIVVDHVIEKGEMIHGFFSARFSPEI
jgi:hypothetical protein